MTKKKVRSRGRWHAANCIGVYGDGDCGVPFESYNGRSKRCPDCQAKYRDLVDHEKIAPDRPIDKHDMTSDGATVAWQGTALHSGHLQDLSPERAARALNDILSGRVVYSGYSRHIPDA